jgi:hypothetical protein
MTFSSIKRFILVLSLLCGANSALKAADFAMAGLMQDSPAMARALMAYMDLAYINNNSRDIRVDGYHVYRQVGDESPTLVKKIKFAKTRPHNSKDKQVIKVIDSHKKIREIQVPHFVQGEFQATKLPNSLMQLFVKNKMINKVLYKPINTIFNPLKRATEYVCGYTYGSPEFHKASFFSSATILSFLVLSQYTFIAGNAHQLANAVLDKVHNAGMKTALYKKAYTAYRGVLKKAGNVTNYLYKKVPKSIAQFVTSIGVQQPVDPNIEDDVDTVFVDNTTKPRVPQVAAAARKGAPRRITGRSRAVDMARIRLAARAR